jgi:secreted PhoX family phosphatase
VQEIDFFGEIAGVAFTPDGEDLYIGISDPTYTSLMHFQRPALGSSDWL